MTNALSIREDLNTSVMVANGDDAVDQLDNKRQQKTTQEELTGCHRNNLDNGLVTGTNGRTQEESM